MNMNNEMQNSLLTALGRNRSREQTLRTILPPPMKTVTVPSEVGAIFTTAAVGTHHHEIH
jgi:hypothetical protein